MKSTLSQLVVVLVAGVIATVGYGLWYSAISTKSAAVENLQHTIDIKTETVNRIATARATLAGAADDVSVVQGYFVPETSIVAFIDSLEVRGKTLGAVVKVLSVSTTGTTAQPTLSLALSVAGTFDAVMRTVGSIEYAPYALSTSALSVSRDAEDSWHANLKILVGSLPVTHTTTTALLPPSSPYVLF